MAKKGEVFWCSERLGQRVSWLVLRLNVVQFDNLVAKVMLNEVEGSFDMLGALVWRSIKIFTNGNR